MPFDVEKIKRDAKKDYEKAWLDTRGLLDLKGDYFGLKNKTKAHPVQKFIHNARNEMLDLGFEELVLPMFVDEKDVYKQYGPEAALILD
ncbi:MAG: O-phosphoserine--tRNA ligase, partial [Promethearchaeia archaeon]